MHSITAAGNGATAINIAAGVSDFQLIDNRCGPFAGFGANDIGIAIQPGASDNYIIAGNDCRGNSGAGLSDGGSGSNKQVYGNLPFTDAESFNIGGGASITRHLSGTATFNPPSLANGATTSVNVSVPGAAPGDTVVANFDQFTDANWAITGFVRAGGSVRVIIQNLTGGTVDLPEGTVRADVWKH